MMRLNAAQSGGLRYRVCPDCGDMHDKYDWPGNHRLPGEVLQAPSVVSDTMDAVQSQGNGKFYDSKSELRKHYRQDGLVEVGNDPARNKPFQKPKPSRKQIKDAVGKAKARFDRGDVGEQMKAKMLATPGPVKIKKGS